MKQNLTPTVIVNKNGVATTVHKKPVTSSTMTSGLPVPIVTKPAAKKLTEAQRNELITQINDHIGTIKYHKDAIRDLLLTYPDNAVTAMHDYLIPEVSDDRENSNRSAFLRVLSDPRFGDNGNTIHEYLTFKTVLQTTSPNVNVGLAVIRSLHGYKQLPVMGSYGDADQNTQDKITALLTVTQDLYNRYKEHQRETPGFATTSGTTGKISWSQPPPMPEPLEVGLPLEVTRGIHLIGDDLISLIIEQPENADAISRTIIKERISDPALLREKFESNIPSMRDGLL